MYKKNDIVINKKGQVCRIIDIAEMNVGGTNKTYYVLAPYFAMNGDSSKFYIPTDIEGMLREPIEKKEIKKVLTKIEHLDVIWYTNPKLRKTKFKEMYDSGDPVNIFIIIKSFEAKKKELINEKKNLSFTDENFLKEIKRNIYNEFAVSLGKDSQEVEKEISKILQQ